MNDLTRRNFMKTSLSAVGSVALASGAWSQIRGSNDDIRIAVVGVRKKGKEHIQDFRKLSGVRVVAICDADTQWLDAEVKKFKDRNIKIDTYVDYRKLLENKNIDAVVLSLPDHWHALMTVWACQAGKDVYVEKPASHNIWEGRKMVEAARKYKRIVEVGSQDRSDVGLLPLAEHIKQGGLGKVQRIHAITYNARLSIGKVSGPQPIPATCDYNLFQGPAPLTPLMRENLHYDWHWCWPTGTGEMGNLGGHVLDDCRWTTGVTKMSPRVISLGGRFGYDDDGQTPNTIISLFDYDAFPIIYEIRALPRSKSEKVDTYQGITWTKWWQVDRSARPLSFKAVRPLTVQLLLHFVRYSDAMFTSIPITGSLEPLALRCLPRGRWNALLTKRTLPASKSARWRQYQVLNARDAKTAAK